MPFTTETPNPLSAVLFAKIFENMDAALAMQGLLNAIMLDSGDTPLAEINELRSETTVAGDTVGLKTTRLDAMAKTVAGEIVCFEVQLSAPSAYDMTDRGLFYGAGQLQGALNVGRGYDEIPRVIVVNLLGYEHPKTDGHYHQVIKFVYCRNKQVASDKLTLHNIELPKFQKMQKFDRDNRLEVWLYMLTEGVKYSAASLGEVITMDASLDQFMKRYHLATRDESTMSKYRSWLKAINDEATERAYMEKLKRQAAQNEQKIALSEQKIALSEQKIAQTEQKIAQTEQKIAQTERQLQAVKSDALRAAVQSGLPQTGAYVMGKQLGMTDDEIGHILSGFQEQ